MPITIKSTELKYKNPSTGQYQGIDAVAERTTSEQCALIEAKGAEVIESIPSDYTALSTKVGSSTLNTTAQNLSDAINEHESDVSSLNGALTKDNLSSTLFETSTLSRVANANDAPYGQSSYDPNTANIPSGSNYGTIHHYYASGWKIQIAYDTNGDVYKRRNINNTGWQAWIKLADMTDISAFSSTNVAQYDTSMGGTLYDSSCAKNGHIVSASGRLTGIDVTAESKAYFLIPDGYRPPSQLRSFGYLYITNVGWVPSMATINANGTVTLGYSGSARATTAAFAATYFSN